MQNKPIPPVAQFGAGVLTGVLIVCVLTVVCVLGSYYVPRMFPLPSTKPIVEIVTELPPGYQLEKSNTGEYRWINPDGNPGAFTYKTPQACLDACRRFYASQLRDQALVWTPIVPPSTLGDPTCTTPVAIVP